MSGSTPADFITTVLEGSFRGKGWQGATLTGSLRGVTPAVATFRPGRGRRCIWEHVLHAAYWKHAVASVLERHLGEAERPTFPRAPANWPRVPDARGRAAERAWAADRALLSEMHERVLRAASRVDPAGLGRPPTPAHRWPTGMYLAGIAAHDAYHCGQVQLLKRLARG